MDFTLDIGYDGHIRLLQLTDFHCGQNMPIWDEAYLEERLLRYIRETINRANPDLMIITGDLFHGKLDDQDEIAKKLCNFLHSFNCINFWIFRFKRHKWFMENNFVIYTMFPYYLHRKNRAIEMHC